MKKNEATSSARPDDRHDVVFGAPDIARALEARSLGHWTPRRVRYAERTGALPLFRAGTRLALRLSEADAALRAKAG